MKKLALFLAFVPLVGVAAPGAVFPPASGAVEAPVSQKRHASFNLSRVPLADLVEILYREVLDTEFVLDTPVLSDDRRVSVRFTVGKDSRADVGRLLASLGLKVERRGGVDLVSKVSQDDRKEDEDGEIFLYRPKYRDVSYFLDLFRNVFGGGFSAVNQLPSQASQYAAGSPGVGQPVPVNANRAPVPGSAPSFMDRPQDVLVYRGPSKRVGQLAKLVEQVDVPAGEVLVRGVVYEVGSAASDGSAVSLALNLLGGKLGVKVGGSGGGDTLSFKNTALEAVVSALATDSRFRVVSSPSLRVRSGASGRFSVGQDVPVLGAVSYTNNNSPVQSVEYRSSGVIFDVRPTVKESVIDVSLSQQLSSFVATSTGVNGSPTLIKRELQSALSLADGETVVLGGLTEDKDSSGRSGLGFLPRIMDSRNADRSRTEILLVLQAARL